MDNIPPTNAKGEYFGQALLSFYDAIPYDSIRTDVLKKIGLTRVDAEEWYDLSVARRLYFGVGLEVGPASLRAIGEKIIDNAVFPEGISCPMSALQSIDMAYELNVRGMDLGHIVFEQVDNENAILEFSTPFPCELDRGIISGCASKFGSYVKVFHDPRQCRDKGDMQCRFEVQVISNGSSH